jgi:hypothetical protein
VPGTDAGGHWWDVAVPQVGWGTVFRDSRLRSMELQSEDEEWTRRAMGLPVAR